MVKCGKIYLFLHINCKVLMLNLLGEYNCRLDAKGRFMLPVALKKELLEVLSRGFVVNRNLHQQCLVLYPYAEWEKLTKKIGSLNRLIKKNDLFIRKVMGGATKVIADGNGRLLLPKSLSEYASLGTEVKVVGGGSTVEIWSKDAYEKVMNEEVDLEGLAEDVMGDITFDDNE